MSTLENTQKNTDTFLSSALVFDTSGDHYFAGGYCFCREIQADF